MGSYSDKDVKSFWDMASGNKELTEILKEISETYGSGKSWEHTKKKYHEYVKRLERLDNLSETEKEAAKGTSNLIKDFVRDTETLYGIIQKPGEDAIYVVKHIASLFYDDCEGIQKVAGYFKTYGEALRAQIIIPGHRIYNGKRIVVKYYRVPWSPYDEKFVSCEHDPDGRMISADGVGIFNGDRDLCESINHMSDLTAVCEINKTAELK